MPKRQIKDGVLIVAAAMQMGIGFSAAAQLTSIQLSYPPAALLAGHEGTVGFDVELTKQGKVKNCRITQSSGYSDLDEQTCLQLRKTGRFKIALDPAGKPMASTYAGRLRWVIPRPAPTAVPSPAAQ